MKQITFIAAVMAALSLAACGGGGGGSEPPRVENPQVEPETPTEAEREAAEQAAREQAQREAEQAAREREEQERREQEAREQAQRLAARLPFPYTPSGSSGVPAWNLQSLPFASLSDVTRLPVYSDGAYLHVGVDQQISGLPTVHDENGYAVRYGTLADGVGRGAIVSYLNSAVGSVVRFSSAPTVRFVGGSTEPRLVERTLSAINMVNAALPENQRIKVNTRTPVATTRLDVLRGNHEENTIYVEFVDALSSAGRAELGNVRNGTIGFAYIRLRRDSQFGSDENLFAVNLVAHELLHALGVQSHVPESLRSIMSPSNGIFHLVSLPLSILHPADRETIRVIYGELDRGDDATHLGAWASTSLHIAGSGPHTNFGVALRNGYAEPWAHGPIPDTDLAANPALAGSVTWEGAILGLTPGAAAVAGDAEIGVNLGTMAGRADFTNLETWAANAAPGEAGTGTQWFDGDLGYLIAVRGNTFRETGGDDGRLTGIFTGRRHEGAAGTLERSDLTAAFGASR